MKIKRISKFFGALLAMLLFVTIASIKPAHATPGPGLAIKPDYPSTQIEKSGSFFLQTEPGQSQKISLNIANLSNTDQTVTVTPTTAHTSDGGAISYDPVKFKSDKSLKYQFSKLVSEKKQRITIKGGDIAKVSFNINPPKSHYKGVIMGGFYVTNNDPSDKSADGGVYTNNKVALAMPILLRDKNTRVIPKLEIGDINPDKLDTKIIVKSQIRNINPTPIIQMNFKDEIYKKSNPSKILSKDSRDLLSMAPNSNFTFTNDLGKNVLLPGDYRLNIKATDNNGNQFSVGKDFHVSIFKAAQYTAQKNWWIILFIVLAFFILVLVYMIYKQRKKQKELLANLKDVKK